MLEKNYVIASYDVYPSGYAKPSAIMRYMQQLAREDCDAMGCTYKFMRDKNTVFVLTKSGLRFFRPIRSGEVVTIKTYNNSIDGIIFDREFDLFAGGKAVGHASTFWVLVKYDTRTLVRPKDFDFTFESFGLMCDKVDVPRRFDHENAKTVGKRTVRVSDLDENDHLNNCVYADIAVDALGDFDGKNKIIGSLKMIFNREARLGDVLSLSVSKSYDAFVVACDNETKNCRCFECEIGFFE